MPLYKLENSLQIKDTEGLERTGQLGLKKLSDSFQHCPVLSHAVRFFPMSVLSNKTQNFCRFFYIVCFMVSFWLFPISSAGKVLSGSFQRCPILSCPVLSNPSVVKVRNEVNIRIQLSFSVYTRYTHAYVPTNNRHKSTKKSKSLVWSTN